MTQHDDDQISLDELFEAFGVSRHQEEDPQASTEQVAPKDEPKVPDTTETDLLHALGIPESALPGDAKSDKSDGDDAVSELEELRAEQRDRALQWKREMSQAKAEGSDVGARSKHAPAPSMDQANTMPLGGETVPLPERRIGLLKPLSVSGSPHSEASPMPVVPAGSSAGGPESQRTMPLPTSQGHVSAQAAFPHPQPSNRVPVGAPARFPCQNAPGPWPVHPSQGQPFFPQSRQSQPVQGQWPPQGQPSSTQIASLEQGRKLPQYASMGSLSALESTEASEGSKGAVAPEGTATAAELQPAAASSWESGIATSDPTRSFVPFPQQGPAVLDSFESQPQPAHEEKAEEAAASGRGDADEGAVLEPASPMAVEVETPEGVTNAFIMPDEATIPAPPTLINQPPLAYSQAAPLPPMPQPLVQQTFQETLDNEERASKATHIIGAALIVMAVACAIVAVCLIIGVFDLTGSNGSTHAPSQSSQVSGQASPSATTSSGAESAEASRLSEVVYSYVVRGVDGGTHEAVETATFGEDGRLVSSRLEISADSQEDADGLLEQLKQDYGDSFIDGMASPEKVECNVSAPRDDLDKDTYTELLSTNASEFKILSE